MHTYKNIINLKKLIALGIEFSKFELKAELIIKVNQNSNKA